MDEDEDFDFDGIDEAPFDSDDGEEQSPAQDFEDPPTAVAAAAACAHIRYGDIDYRSDDLANHSPEKKPRSGDSRKSGGGRKFGSKSTRQVHFGPTDEFVVFKLTKALARAPAPPQL